MIVIARRPAQGFDKPHQGRQRGAQLVADIGDKISPHLVGLFAFGHIQEGDQYRAAFDSADTGNIPQFNLVGGVLRAIV
jgi:hypothetical protein